MFHARVKEQLIFVKIVDEDCDIQRRLVPFYFGPRFDIIMD